MVIALSIVRTKKKDYKIEVNKLVDYLGGKNNILDYAEGVVEAVSNYIGINYVAPGGTSSNGENLYTVK